MKSQPARKIKFHIYTKLFRSRDFPNRLRSFPQRNGPQQKLEPKIKDKRKVLDDTALKDGIERGGPHRAYVFSVLPRGGMMDQGTSDGANQAHKSREHLVVKEDNLNLQTCPKI